MQPIEERLGIDEEIEEDDDDDENGIAMVGARLNPKPSPRISSIVLPEPD